MPGVPLRLISPSLALLSFTLAFLQRPGRSFTDTRIELTVDPVRFLHNVASVWSSTEDLGHVQSGQFVGYLAPMAPWYAFAHEIGISPWVAERIWLGTLLALASWGVVRLLEVLLDRPPGLPHAIAGLLFMANPYVVVAISRATIVLLAYAALPWLLVCAHRGLRAPGSWRRPAMIGLLFALAGGGVNAALLFWISLAPIGLLIYEVSVVRSATWRAAGRFTWRAALCTFVACLWWIVPVLLQARYGANFLKFSEQPFTILATPSISESLRLLGYWLIYFGIGTGPAVPSVGVAGLYLFNRAVILATFAAPLLAFASVVKVRRWIYAPYFVMLAMVGLFIMSAGFPPGGPFNRLVVSAYFHVGALQTLRTTWKATPLMALPLACLAGVGTAALVNTARSRAGLHIRRLRIPAWTFAGLLAVPVLWALPLFDGTAVDANIAYGSVPGYWRVAMNDATDATNANQRIMILPGELFGWYTWGGTTDSIAPSLTTRPVLVRETLRISDPRASQLQTAIDDLVQQDRLVPGQLEPLLGLLGVGAVLVPADGNLARDGALAPALVADSLRDQSEFKAPLATYGRSHIFLPPAGRGGPPISLPDIRRYAGPARAPGVMRVQPVAGTTILDGDGNGIAELAAARLLDPRRALVYAADLNRRRVSSLVAGGARLVFTDSNQLQIVGPTSLTTDAGPTLEAGDPIAPDTPTYDVFPRAGVAAETVANYSGLAYLRSPGLRPQGSLLPQDGPYAALDGRLDTAWVADQFAPPSQRYIELALRSPRRVSSIEIYPLDEQLGLTTEVGVEVNGGRERNVSLAAGWNAIQIGANRLRTLRIRIISVLGFGSPGGISELRIPGVQAPEALRLPTVLASESSGLDLSHNDIAILLQRTTADFPYRENPQPGQIQALSPLYETDAELGIRRIVTLPVARSFTADGWANVSPNAPDGLIDQLVALRRGWRFESSARFEGVPIRRASSAFDGNPKTAWVAPYDFAHHEYPWIEFSAPRPVTIGRLYLTPGPPQYEFPSVVRITAPGAAAQLVSVRPDGAVLLPHALRTRQLRLQVVIVRYPIGTAEFSRFLDAVAIAEIRVPGLKPPAPRRSGRFATRCGALSIISGNARLPLQVRGTIAALDQGEPLPVRGCGAPPTLSLLAGTNELYSGPGSVMSPDHLALDSYAPAPLPAPAVEAIASPGVSGDGSQTGVRPGAKVPSWLVLGQSYSPGWQARCTDSAGRDYSLGPPTPIDGFANGWQINGRCVGARMSFAPQATADLAYLISPLAGVVLLFLAIGAGTPTVVRRRLPRRLRRPLPPPRPISPPGLPVWTNMTDGDLPRITSWPRALSAGALVGAGTSVLFAIRLGVCLGPLTVILLRLGVNVKRLVVIGALALAAIPVVYLTNPPPNDGGFSFTYSLHYIFAHWLGATALCALLAAGALQAMTVRRLALRRAPSAPGHGERSGVPQPVRTEHRLTPPREPRR